MNFTHDPIHGVEYLPEQRIPKSVLATQSAVPLHEIDRAVELGLIPGPDAAGLYDGGNIMRLRLLRGLRDSDIPLDSLADAVAKGQLSLDFASSLVSDWAGIADMTVGEACGTLGIDDATLQGLSLATGIPFPSKDTPVRRDDLDLMSIFADARSLGVPAPVIFNILRTFSIGMTQIVTAQREFFRRNVEDPMLAKGKPFGEMFAETAPVRLMLQRLGYRATFVLQRRFIERVALENLIWRIEEAMENFHAMRPHFARRHAIAFADLSGFTERTEDLGDEAAAKMANDLVAISHTRCIEYRGHLVKPLGDGVMMYFPDAGDAVHCSLAIVGAAKDRSMPPIRAGIAAGPVIMQDGDYYGRTVNIASRLLGVAIPNQILVTNDVVDAVTDPTLIFEALAPVHLKGVNEIMRAYSVRTA